MKLTQLQRTGISFLLLRYRENGNHWLEKGTIRFNNNPRANITTMFIRCMNNGMKTEIIYTLMDKEMIDDNYSYQFKYDGSERLFHIIDDEEIKVVNAD